MNDSLARLPRKVVSGAMLLLDEAGRLLILKPTYKDGWEIPGGLAEAGESPWQAAHREVLEEVGLDREAGALLSVEWRPPMENVGDGVHFIFDGGLVTAAQAASLRLQASEIAEARFLPPEEACALLPGRLAARVRPALAVRPHGPPVYLEAGHTRGGPGYVGAPEAEQAHLDALVTPHGDPFAHFDAWYAEAAAVDPQAQAVNLATTDARGRPSSRMVLIRNWSPAGFEFYTDTESRKGLDLAANPFGALCWHWKAPLQRQVRVEGRIERLPEASADAYWQARPRAQLIGRVTSHQSQPIEGREALLGALSADAALYPGPDRPPRPARWGGYLVIPERFEFWVHDDDRFHRRLEYARTGEGWVTRVLQP